MNSNKSKQILILIILAASFLIEYPLSTTVISIFSFFAPLGYWVINITFYSALFACFLILKKPDITAKAVMKSLCVVLVFLVLEDVLSKLSFSAIIALAYQIIRPLLLVGAILWANRWIIKSKINFNKIFLVITGVLFIIGALFNVFEYIRFITAMQNLRNDIFSYLDLLPSAYSTMAEFCTYGVTFMTLCSCTKSTGDVLTETPL